MSDTESDAQHTAERGAALAARQQLFDFAAAGGRLLAEAENNNEVASEHPLLVPLARWLRQAETAHAANLQDGTASGLLAHLSDTWSWTTNRLAFGTEFRATLGQISGSSVEIGQTVDAELGALTLGAKLTETHVYTCLLLRFLRERNWLPLTTQVPLWHRSNAIYTFIDLLAYDPAAKQLVLVELKTGFDYGYDTPLCDLHRECDVFVDTPRLRHQQQLCWMQVVLQAELAPIFASLADTTPLRACIVRVSNAAGAREPDWSEQSICDYFTHMYITNDPAYTTTAPANEKR